MTYAFAKQHDCERRDVTMISCHYVISTNHGLHAANAMSISRAASEYQCKITLGSSRGVADCKNVLSLMSLGAKQGDSLVLTADGPDEKQAVGYLSGILRTIL